MKRIPAPGIVVFVLLASAQITAARQPADTVDSLLHQIALAQQKEPGYFFKGSFASYRRYGRGQRLKPDNNIYFTGILVFTLRRLEPYLTPGQRQLCEQVRKRALEAYPYFRNKTGLPTYNFWHVDPPLIFPHSWFLNHFNESYQLPDDLDDTVILWLCQDPSRNTVLLVKKLMEQHANGEKKQIKNIFKRYRDIPAYTTWFGKETPLEFDFSVLCNVLYFVHYYHLKPGIPDSASVLLLEKLISDKSYIRHPSYISPNYGRTPVLLYHIARLLEAFSIPVLDSLKPELLAETRRQYRQADCWLDRVLLSTTSIWLGGKPLPVTRPEREDLWQSSHTFFVASLATVYPNLLKRVLLGSDWLKYYYVCSTYRKCLYLENLVLRKNYLKGKKESLVFCH